MASPRSAVDELKAVGRLGAYAYGDYICFCSNCQTHFSGDKRAVRCLPCMINELRAKIEETA